MLLGFRRSSRLVASNDCLLSSALFTYRSQTRQSPTFSAFGLNLTCGNYYLEHATFCSFLSTSNCHLECARSWECSLVLFASRARQDQPSLGEQEVFLKATSPPLHLDGERGGGKRTATRRLGGNFWRPTSPSPHIVFPSIASRLSLTF